MRHLQTKMIIEPFKPNNPREIGKYEATEKFLCGNEQCAHVERGNTHYQAIKNCLASIKAWTPAKFK